MKNYYIFLLFFCFACANVYAQEFPKPELTSPEATFYTYLDNEKISDPTKYNGNVKKVTVPETGLVYTGISKLNADLRLV